MTPAMAQALEGRVLMATDFRISEFMASNVSTLADEDGQYNDWIEIRNTGDAAGNLAGYRLTDNAAQVSQWTFPSVSVPAGGHLVVFASGKDRTDPAGPYLHTNFSLNADGEYLALVAPDGTKKSEFSPRFPGQEADVSYGTDYAAAGQPLRYFATPTPGAANTRAEAVINEIHYDPDVKTQLVEFLELTNPGSAPVDLSGAYFSDGITYTFPQGTTLAPGAYLVLAENAAQFQAKFGSAPFGQYAGSLSNDGETVRLKNKSGGTLDMVDYQPGFPWPTVGEAPGYSIELINPDFDNSVGGNWRAQPPAQTAGTTLVPSGSTWKYLKGTAEASNPVSDWRQVTFPDASWSAGTAPIGYDGNSTMGTRLSDMQGGYTSVFMRKTFTVNDPAAFNALKLEANFDDGFNVWINGTFAYSQNVAGGQNAAYNGTASSTIEDTSFRPFNLPGGLLRAGTNVIAVQFFNSSLSSSSDAFFDGRLIASASGASPTPGRRNSVYADNAAPQMRQVNNAPEQPTGGDVVTVTAKITDPDGVASATLQYQVVTPGNYIAIDDPAYQTDWTAVAMHDDGTAGDAVGGDGIYSAQVPASANQHRNLVRYRVSSTDSRGASITAPYADDSVPNFAYFVYDGIPAWTGAAQPGVTPDVTYSADVMNSVQAFHLISQQSQVEDATWWSKYGGDNYLWKGTLVFNGKVYDHIRYRTRGGSAWRYAMGKNAWKIDFNHNHDLEMTDDYGNPYSEKWGKLSLRANIQQGNYWHRGEQGLFESVGYKLFNLAGTPAERTTFVQLRIIDAPEESTADQYTGDLWGGYLAVEEPDNHFLDEHGLPDGNIYDMEGGTGYLNNQGPTGVTDKSDLNAFLNTYTTTTPTEDWWRANLDLSAYYAYRTILEGIHHYDVDQSAGKNYFYYLNPETNQWMVLPWDLDLTWSDNMYGGGDEPFKSRVLPKPNLNIEYKNAIRNIRDLLFNSDQAGQVIDEMAAKVWTPGQPSFVDVDRAMWDYNPVLDDPARTYGDKGGTGRFYKGNPAAGVVIPAPGGFPGMIQKMKNYVATRAGVLDGLASDSAIPAKPTLTYTGAANFPADGVRFHSSNFSDTTGTFAGMQWRLAEVTNPNAPGYDPKAPKLYEINSTWDSGELSTFTPDMTIPAQYLQAGHTYRVRVRMKDSTGRWSNWSNAAQFIPGLPDQTVKDALRITEINYHPAPNPAGPPAEDEFEFVELQNTSATAINLKDVKFTNGIDYVFGDFTLDAGQYVVVARNRDAFAQRYGTAGINLAPGNFTKALDNGQDHVVLVDATNQTIHDFTYLDTWYPSTDGEGPTLVVADAHQPIDAWNTAVGWKASAQDGGSPGAADAPDTTAPTADIVDVSPDPRNSPVDSVTIIFSEPVIGFDLSDLTLTTAANPATNLLTAAQALNSADGGRTWTLSNLTGLTFAPAAQFVLTLKSSGTGITDGVGNPINTGATETWTTDTAAPTANVTDVTPDPRKTPVNSITIVFSEPVVGFDKSDLTLTRNGGANLIASFHTLDTADGGRTWVLGGLSNQTGPEGTYVLTVGTGVTDAAGNTLAAPASDQWVVDFTAPTADVTDVAPDPRATPVDSIQIVFSEQVVGFDKSDLALTRNGGGNLIAGSHTLTTGDGGRTWTLGGLANETGPEGTYVLTVGTGIADAAGNALAAPATDQWVVDSTPPTADIVDVTPDPRDQPVDSITIRFSEPVTGFDPSDLRLTREDVVMNLTDAQTLTTTDGGVTWVLGNLADLTPQGGRFTLSLFAASSNIQDAAGNALVTDASDSWTEGQVAPTSVDLFVRGVAWSSAFKAYLEQKGVGDDAFGYQVASRGSAMPGPTQNPEQILPWINANELVLRYDGVPIGSGIPTPQSVVLTSQQGVAYTVLSVVQDAGDPTVYVVTLDKPLGGGNPATGTAPTPQQNGDRITVTVPAAGFGGPASIRLNVLQGDTDHTGENGTHSVLAADFSLVKKKFFTSTTTAPTGSETDYSAFADVDGSGQILANDFSEVKKRFFHNLPGAAPAQAAPATVTGTELRVLPSTATKDLFGSTPILG
jgi:hypothetical protein